MGRAVIENIDGFWLNEEEWLMKRLKQIISGDEHGPFRQTDGYDWQLDSSNDWWAELQGKNLVVAYRYGNSDVFTTLIPFLTAYFCEFHGGKVKSEETPPDQT
jgi:hypothetical protein